MSSAVANALHAATAAVSFAAMRERSKFGVAIAAMMAMIATTIINSISVKPLLFMFVVPLQRCWKIESFWIGLEQFVPIPLFDISGILCHIATFIKIRVGTVVNS